MSALALAVERYREALLLEKLVDEAAAKTKAACRSHPVPKCTPFIAVEVPAIRASI